MDKGIGFSGPIFSMDSLHMLAFSGGAYTCCSGMQTSCGAGSVCAGDESRQRGSQEMAVMSFF